MKHLYEYESALCLRRGLLPSRSSISKYLGGLRNARKLAKQQLQNV